MQKITKFLTLTMIVCAMLCCGCKKNASNAQSVAIWETTSAGSTDATFFVSFFEEKDYKNLGVDVWIKCNEEIATFKIKKELCDFVTISLPEKDTFFSLYKLMASASGEKFEYTTYKDAISKAYIINSEKEYNLTIKAVVGEISTYKSMLTNTFDVSKEFNILVKAKENK